VKDLGGNALASNKTFSFTPLWTTKQLGSSSDDYAKDIAIDSSGNFYITGKASGELDGNTYGGGFGDTILVKYNSSVVKQWTKQIATSTNDAGYGVDTDSSGNVFVGGSISYKFDSSGTQLWTKNVATMTMAVATDSSGNSYFMGYTTSSMDSNSNAGGNDVFLVKYNSGGTKQWSSLSGTTSEDYGLGLSVDSNNNIYLTGHTKGSLDGNTNAGAPYSDIFLIKYYDNGTKHWTKQLGTSLNDYGMDVTVDSSDNIYVAAYVEGELDGNNYGGSGDIALIKYYDNGTKHWTQQLGTTSGEQAQGVATDSSGNIYITGYTSGGLDGNSNSGSQDIFLVKYNSSGTKQWTKQLGTSSNDSGQAVVTDSSGDIHITGNTSGGLDGNTNSGDQDIFLVKYNSSGTKQ